MSGRLDHACGNFRHTLAERGHDLYETPPEAVRSLLRHYTPRGTIWEPACGPGAIVRELRAAGHSVWATDLVDYGTEDQDFGNSDFLAQHHSNYPVILTNPPFKHAHEFIRHALRMPGATREVVMLLRLSFLESERRCDILDGAGLARILPYRKRLPMMHRAGWEGRKANSGMAFAWFIWQRGYEGLPTVERISWEKSDY